MKRLVVVGDVLLDVDVLTRAERLTPDAPVPVLDEISRELRPGGAALAALLAARDREVEVTLIAPLADDQAARDVRARLSGALDVVALPASGRTPVKTRLRAGGQTVARLDAGGDVDMREVTSAAVRSLSSADAVLVSDYGGGTTRDRGIRNALARCGAPIVWDPHPLGADPIEGVALATPNLSEALRLSATPAGSGDRPPVALARRAAEVLLARWRAHSVCVTLGAHGAILAFGTGSSEYLPVERPSGGDACGAGDCFAAAAAAALAGGALPSQAVASAVRSAAAFIGAGGVASLGSKNAEIADENAVTRTRRAGGVVVATGGCFDLLHAGHVHTLAAARSLGDCLVVLLNSDESVRRIKGPTRPLQSQADRARVLGALRDVDAVMLFEEDTPERALGELRPDIWVKGGDYVPSQLPETELVQSWGGEIVTVGFVDGKSTSTLVELARK